MFYKIINRLFLCPRPKRTISLSTLNTTHTMLDLFHAIMEISNKGWVLWVIDLLDSNIMIIIKFITRFPRKLLTEN